MKSTYLYVALVIALIVILVLVRNSSPGGGSASKVTRFDGFAQCLTDAGAKFYGAYWCPHCQNQKKLFENSAKLPYFECSLPDGKTQNKTCNDVGVESYPTWVFADGSRETGEQSFEDLAAKTNCPLPEA